MVAVVAGVDPESWRNVDVAVVVADVVTSAAEERALWISVANTRLKFCMVLCFSSLLFFLMSYFASEERLGRGPVCVQGRKEEKRKESEGEGAETLRAGSVCVMVGTSCCGGGGRLRWGVPFITTRSKWGRRPGTQGGGSSATLSLSFFSIASFTPRPREPLLVLIEHA